MALSVQLKGMQRVPLCSPTVHVGRVIALIVRGSVRSGTLLGIWGGATRRCRSQVSTTASEPDIQRRIAPGLIPWWAPVLMLAARPVFALATQLAVAAGFRLKRHPKPLLEAGRWWMVSGTLIDLLCLGMLTWLTRREGMRLTDLLNVRRERLGRDLVLALGDLVALT